MTLRPNPGAGPLVSVVIPAYDQASFVGEAIRSVLDQTYEKLEVIVVDDCSPDNTAEVVQSFCDGRLRYIRHEHNRMLAAARNTGLRAAHGELLALLDADDYYDPRKLALHVDYLQRNPAIGVSCNGRYNLECHSPIVRDISPVPTSLTLADLVLGFPFTPSDMVLRRQWAFAVNLFDESCVYFSEDLDINCRLALAGCRFGGVDRCLNYRRMHAGRVVANIRQRLDAALQVLHATFASACTPPEVRALQGRAYANNYIVWGVEALRQCDTAAGVEFLLAALQHNPAILQGRPNQLTTFLVYEAIHDEAQRHEEIYRTIVEQLPGEFFSVAEQAQWGIGRGWLVKAYRALIWGDVQEGRRCLAQAGGAGAIVDKAYMDEVVHQLLALQTEQGAAAANDVARRLDVQWRSVQIAPPAPSFAAALELGRVFAYFDAGRYDAVPGQVRQALRSNPRLALNRGLLSLLVRSVRNVPVRRPDAA